MLLGAQGPWGSAGPCECPATPCHPQGPSRLGVLIQAVTQNVFTDRTVFLAPVR